MPAAARLHLAALLGASLCAPAASGLSLQLRWDQLHYRAGEFAPNGFRLNEDSGTLRGPGLALRHGLGGWRVGAELQALRGDLAYDGFTQFGLPLRSQTALRLRRIALTLAPVRALPLGPLVLEAGAALGALQIERAIQATAISLPTTETLQSRYAALDAGARWHRGAVSWTARIGVQHPLRERLAVDTFGVFDDYSLRPAARWSSRANLRLAVVPAPGWTLALQAERQWLHFGAAPAQLVTRGGVPAGFSSYPGSRQVLSGLALLAERDF